MKRLQSLDVWQRSNELARLAYRLTLNAPLSRHFGVADQIRRAAISIPANLAEGYALSTTAQFIRCVRIAHGSAEELLCHLSIVSDLGLAPAREAADALALCDRVIALLIGTQRGLRAASPAR